jgi:hypothetical protein
VTTGIGVGVAGGGGGAAGLAGTGVGTGVTSLATDTFVVVQLMTTLSVAAARPLAASHLLIGAD